MIAIDTSGEKWSADAKRQAAAHSTPAAPANMPDTARIPNFTEAGITPNADAARSLSRTATTRRAGPNWRSAPAAATATVRTTSAT